MVDTPEHREEFKRYYRIPSNVSIQHCNPGEWHEKRPTGAVVIPTIAFIERGMRILIGRVTKDFLNLFRLCPTQCVPNMFKILGCVEALKEKVGYMSYPSRHKLGVQLPERCRWGILLKN